MASICAMLLGRLQCCRGDCTMLPGRRGVLAGRPCNTAVEIMECYFRDCNVAQETVQFCQEDCKAAGQTVQCCQGDCAVSIVIAYGHREM